MKSEPSRTCLGCREARPKSGLVRLIRVRSGIVVVDAAARAAGRGAYVCPDAACVERALVRGRLAHAFRQPCVASPDLAAAVVAAGRREPKKRRDAAGVREADVMAARV
jgi:uncharacterized protein